MSNYQINLEKHSFIADQPGNHLVIAARIHGNEPSGEIASRQIIREIHEGTLKLVRGGLTIFPSLNVLAKEQDLRWIWGDANRDVTAKAKGKTPEDAIRRAIARELIALNKHAPALTGHLTSWHFLDLHSVPQPGKAHAILSEGEHDLTFAKALGTDTIYTGWRRAQLNVDKKDITALGRNLHDHKNYTRALIYAARESGAKSSICLELGQNDDPLSVEIAYRGIRNSLAFHKLTNKTSLPYPVPDNYKFIRFDRVLIPHDGTQKLIGVTKDAQPVQPGQVIFGNASRQVCVPDDGNKWIVAHPFPGELKKGQFAGFLAQVLG